MLELTKITRLDQRFSVLTVSSQKEKIRVIIPHEQGRYPEELHFVPGEKSREVFLSIWLIEISSGFFIKMLNAGELRSIPGE